MDKNLIIFQPLIDDIKSIISMGLTEAYTSVNKAAILTYWNIGKRIVEEEQKGGKRAEYGASILSVLSAELSNEFGRNYSERNLAYYRKFYECFPDCEIVKNCAQNLTWSHFRCLLRVSEEDARNWYLNESFSEGWSVRTLDRNISTQYYYRILKAPDKNAVKEEMINKTASYPLSKYELIKSPMVAEFLGFENDETYLESDLENAILSHIRDYLLEMGRGFSFVGRQQHIVTDTEDCYIDLVFYNIELKCYVLVDLKTGKITSRDVGQMDMYVRMFDDLKRVDGDNPTLGIILCSETSETVAKYSMLQDSDRLFMSKYLTYMPTEEQLKREIQRQKEIFYIQHPSLKDDDE